MPNEFLPHESNLIGKISSNYKGLGVFFKIFKDEIYDDYKSNQLSISETTKESISRKTSLLNEYYIKIEEFYNKMEKEHNEKITSQSKFRPTILEEFCGFLFKDIQVLEDMDLNFFNKRIFAGILLDKNGNASIKTKDVDFCIGKQFYVEIGGSEHNIIIPIVAIECKTYIDKTMFSEAQFTAQKMKQGSPNVRVYVISEDNQIDKNEIPTKGQTPGFPH